MIITHIVPVEDVREHECEPTCWCRPEWDAEGRLYVHNAMDDREAYERGERKPN